MTMKTVPEGMRPYERMEKFGAEVLSDAELLAILIKTGTKEKSALTIAEEMLLKYGSLTDVSHAGFCDLQCSKGIGRVKAIEISAAAEIGRRIAFGRKKDRIKITDYEYLSGMLIAEMHTLKQEVFKVLLFDKKWNFISSVCVSYGTVEKTLVHPREVFYHAVKNLASAIIAVHNHPSGEYLPGKADIRTTERLIRAGGIMGIDVIDHIVIGNGTCYSMQREGDIEKIRKKIMIEENGFYGT